MIIIGQITEDGGVLFTPIWLVELRLVDKIEPIVSFHVVYYVQPIEMAGWNLVNFFDLCYYTMILYDLSSIIIQDSKKVSSSSKKGWSKSIKNYDLYLFSFEIYKTRHFEIFLYLIKSIKSFCLKVIRSVLVLTDFTEKRKLKVENKTSQ